LGVPPEEAKLCYIDYVVICLSMGYPVPVPTLRQEGLNVKEKKGNDVIICMSEAIRDKSGLESKRTPALLFPILANGSRSRGAQTGRPCPPGAHLLGSLAQPGSGLAHPQLRLAAIAQVQRRKWKLLMSRFRYRTTCFIV